MIDYKKQVIIIKIKANVQYFVYYIFLQEWENFTKHGYYLHTNPYIYSLKS